MNTTEKGNKFEDQVKSIMNDLLNDPTFYLNNKSSKVLSKKQYYSESRKGNIIVDISIESYFGESQDYSMLTIVECKNLSHPVPVDDVEELDSKLNQIGAHNTKGMIFSKSGFQKSALNLAKSKGIALVRVNNSKDIDWVNHRKDRKTEVKNIEEILSSNQTRQAFLATNGHKLFESLPDLFIELGIIDLFKNQSKYIPIPYLKDDEISERIKKIIPDGIYENDVLNENTICDFISDTYKAKFSFDEKLDDGILGKINLKTLVINVNPLLKKEINRWRFTLAHEIGHLILHKELLGKYILENVDRKEHLSLSLKTLDFNKRMEIQANIFAATLLLPYKSLKYDIAKYFNDNNINKGFLYLDEQARNRNTVYTFLGILQSKYKISNEVAKIRLKQLHLLKDETDISIKSIMREIY